MNIPEDLRNTRDHEWVLLEDGIVIVGITDFAQTELGDIVYVELPTIGAVVKASDTFGNVESVKSVSDLYSPVTGEVVAVNDILDESPETVNEDCYGDGWMVAIAPTSPDDFEALLSAAGYAQHVKDRED